MNDEAEDVQRTHFTHKAEFQKLLDDFLSVELKREPSEKEDELESSLVRQLGFILDLYLAAPGLLDPHLGEIVSPLMAKLSICLLELLDANNTISAIRLSRLGRVINWVVKLRGWKATVPYFPSELSNIPTLVSLLSPTTQPSTSSDHALPYHPKISGLRAWELRAVMILWLTLLLTIPFALSTLNSISEPNFNDALDSVSRNRLFPESSTRLAPLAQRIIILAIPLLRLSGKEGSYAALLLARLFSRSDAVDHLPAFLNWAGYELEEGDRDRESHFVANLLQMLASAPAILPLGHLEVLRGFMDEKLLPHLRGSWTAKGSGLIRKMAVKARGRWWVTKLGKGLQEEDEPPDGLEEALDDLMTGLSDKDTIVRYSSAKYLARITALLPPSFAQQVVRNTIDAFEGTEDEPVVLTSFGTVLDPGGTSSVGGTMGFGGADSIKGEARWHGVCLALAELARQGLLDDEDVGLAVPWVLKALNFDIRKASHSVGANVRDAAAYVLWSLSRAASPEVLKPFATDLATAMVCEACFDREVGVRRAASAAFQEGVGRLGMYPEGIDVLAKTDFYSVSIRRMSFSVSAPAVAVHKVYRDRLRHHLHHITLRHWDSSMRLQGANALRELLIIEPLDLDDSICKELVLVASLDQTYVHGAIAALAAIALNLAPLDSRRQAIFSGLSTIRPSAFISPAAAEILVAACELISNTLDPSIIELQSFEEILLHITEATMRRKEPECHEAVAHAFSVLSRLRSSAREVERLLRDLRSARAAQVQSATLCLGSISYALCPSSFPVAVEAVLHLLDPSAKADIETRRYAVRSLANLACQVDAQTTSLIQDRDFVRIFDALIVALNDYTTDQRGDVGSWVRAASLTALGKVISYAAGRQSSPSRGTLISQDRFEHAVAGVIALAVEKLEPVRGAAAGALRLMRHSGASKVWVWEGCDCFAITNCDIVDDFRRVDQLMWYASAMPLLRTRYRTSLMTGLALVMGTQMESTANLAVKPLEKYLGAQSISQREMLVSGVLVDFLAILTKDFASNRIIVPTLGSLVKICEMQSVRQVMEESSTIQNTLAKIHAAGMRSFKQVKSIERISGLLKLTLAWLALPVPIHPAKAKAVESLALFLEHRFPRIRTMCAEQLYLTLMELDETANAQQVKGDPSEELEDLLLETEWLKIDPQNSEKGEGPAQVVVRLLRGRL